MMSYRDRLAAHVAPELSPGEQVAAVARGAQGGWAPFMVVGAVIGFATGWLTGGVLDAPEVGSAVGVAVGTASGTMWWTRRMREFAVPPFLAVAATTTGRLLVVERDPILGRAREVVLAQPPGEPALAQTRRTLIDRRASLIVDGTSFDLRFPVGQDIEGVIAATRR